MADTNFEHLDPLLLDLKILADVGQHEKILTHSAEITVHANSILLAWTRWRKGETRQTNLAYITDLLVKIRREIDEFVSERRAHPVMLERIRTHLIGARKGLENMVYTYQDDITTKAKYNTQIEVLDDQVLRIEQFQAKQLEKKRV